MNVNNVSIANTVNNMMNGNSEPTNRPPLNETGDLAVIELEDI